MTFLYEYICRTASLFLLVALVSCVTPEARQAVEYAGDVQCAGPGAEDERYGPLECRVRADGDTLTVHILPPGWMYITLKIQGGAFSAKLDGVPFSSSAVPTFETVRQRLRLLKESRAPGDTLCGKYELRFRITDPETGQAQNRDFRGTICGIIRDKDFEPFSAENYLTFDLPTALHELGEPLDRRVFTMENVTKFSIELRNFFPRSADIVCEQVTWDAGPMRGISDEGRERVTIWYVEKEGRRMPVHYREWNIDQQL